MTSVCVWQAVLDLMLGGREQGTDGHPQALARAVKLIASVPRQVGCVWVCV